MLAQLAASLVWLVLPLQEADGEDPSTSTGVAGARSEVAAGEIDTQLVKEGLGKADALWAAKMALREEGRPVRDWTGWVLTGDPNRKSREQTAREHRLGRVG